MKKDMKKKRKKKKKRKITENKKDITEKEANKKQNACGCSLKKSILISFIYGQKLLAIGNAPSI